LLLLCYAVPVSAQNYPYPGDVAHPAVICSGCPGTNSSGQLNDGLPTFPYDTPVSKHTGRFVDSSNVSNYQAPVRTIRSGLVRVAPSAQNRIYLALGGMVGAYTLDTFFTGKLAEGMVSLTTVFHGVSRPGGTEKLAKPDRYFYAESNQSGWSTQLFDIQDVLYDFDADDRGYLYPATLFGWGIASDPGGSGGSHLPFVAQVTADNDVIKMLLSIRNGSSYHVYHSNAADRATLYDVTTPASPVFSAMRTGSSNAFKAWSKYETGQRVALLNIDGHARVYSYAGLITGAEPLADLTPSAGKFFADLSFDDSGNLWMAESTNSVSTNSLRKEAPSGEVYTTTLYDVYGPNGFSPRKIHASAGYIAVAGQVTSAFDLRLLKVVGGSPQLQETGGFIEKYYHRAPSGYAQPGNSLLMNVRLVAQGGKTYLFYNDFGLGDVYEIPDIPRITSIAPMSGSPVGGTNVDIYGSGFLPGTTVTFDGLTASSSFVSITHMTAVSPAHASGPVDVVVSVPLGDPMTAPSPFTYILDTPQPFTATATSTDSVSLSWNSIPGAVRYEVSRRLPAGTWTVIGTPSATSLTDGALTAETTYVYRVRADDGAANFSAYSAIDLATTMTGASANIVAGAPILAADVAHLRTRVNAVRAAAGLSAYSFTGPLSGVVLAQDVTELRTALTQGRTTLGFAAPTYTDLPTVNGLPIKAVHFNELLDLMR
jgi:hypothetical protein